MSPYFPDVFPAFWQKFNAAVAAGAVTSTREVLGELLHGPDNHMLEWCKANKEIFGTPNAEETQFVTEIFAVQHFQQIIGTKQTLRGTPVADPFVIAKAYTLKATVVTEESTKPNSPNIPAICQHFKIPCMKLGGFLRANRWTF
jgi:Domain of unknown function (DUF4411)